MKKKKLIPCIIAIVAIVLLGIAGVKLYQLMFGGAVKVQTADIISAIAQMKLQLIIGAVILIAGIVILIIGLRKKDENLKDLLKVQGIVFQRNTLMSLWKLLRQSQMRESRY